VLERLAHGGRVATVAKALFISRHTVRNHLRSIFSKLGVHSQPELLEHVRDHPEVLGPESPAPSRGHADAQVEAYERADRQLTERIAKAFLEPPGAPRLRAILRQALPLDAERAEEWRVRLDLWCQASDSPRLGKIHEAQLAQRQTLMAERIATAQQEGWVQPDVDPEELALTLRSLILSATIQILQHPASQDIQLGFIDAYVDSVASE